VEEGDGEAHLPEQHRACVELEKQMEIETL